jgi:class 3 adenylate cyclase
LFSDIKDFTQTTERLQPEELTALINEYFTEMSTIAFAHGGTVDKFVGDAMSVFFGDPQTLGEAEDAKACVRMAIAMQARLAELNVMWQSRGIASPFRVRMGINTGFCDVGNFGSDQRMDYTIIGAAMNLAARLESIAEPGTIIVSAETFARVRDIVAGHPLPAVQVRGISAPVIPYVIDGLLDVAGRRRQVFAEHAAGLDFYLDITRIENGQAEHVRTVLQSALDALQSGARAASE